MRNRSYDNFDDNVCKRTGTLASLGKSGRLSGFWGSKRRGGTLSPQTSAVSNFTIYPSGPYVRATRTLRRSWVLKSDQLAFKSCLYHLTTSVTIEIS